MALDTVTLVLDGEVPLEEFARTIERFSELVNALSDHVGAPGLDWVLDDLQVSSAIATARAPSNPEAAERVVNAYADVGAALESNTPPSVRYSERVRTAASQVVSIQDGRIRAVRFETPIREATVRTIPGRVIEFPESETAKQIKAVLVSPVVFASAPAFGAIQGRVQTLSNRGGLRFTLYDLLYDKAISCYVAEGKEELLRGTWGKLATVEGMITRDPVTGRPLAIRQVSKISELPEPYSKCEYEDARAISPSVTGLSPEEAIRRIRDAH